MIMIVNLYCAYNNNNKQQPFNGRLSGTTRVGRYQKKHSPAHTHPGKRTSFITFLHLQRSMASSLFSLRAWQSSRTTSFQVLFGLPLGLEPSASYSMHFFTQSSSSFRSTCTFYLSEARCILFAWSSWCHCTPKHHHLLPRLNPDWFYFSGLPRLSWKKAF